MTNQQLDEERIFHVARDIAAPESRAEYLDQVCARDQALRKRVEKLLRVYEQEQSFLKSNSDPLPTEAIGELNVRSGQQIGRYKLLQKIGEGGFGVVFMAEQSQPVRRKVALKVIKPGMDTEAVVARFEAERQALAMMDHPNIARVFDGGATDGGRPYFVMELVKGVPITEYCDKNELSTDQRLRLFTTVCQAVQHAHQKGIIHRDLKPSNVLVTLADGEPIVKVIDFGVAKATNQQLTEKTLFTAFGQMVGTPQYMSPEQAEMSCLDVDTRSDVYSLGVLLYELLTGTTPLEAERLRTAGYAEMQRLIREEEPPKPSTRLSTSGNKLTILAKHRKVTPEKLKSQVKGDLDWVVMKALEKDRNRRYVAPSELGEDVTRYLSNQPVEAYPPSTAYRIRKFIRRNGSLVAGATVFTLLLLMTTTVASRGWLHASMLAADLRKNEDKLTRRNQELEAKNDLLQKSFLDRAIADALGGNFLRAEISIAQAKEAGADQDVLAATQGLALYFSGDVEIAIQKLREATQRNPHSIAAWSVLYLALGDAGQYEFQGQCRSHLLEIDEPETDHERMFRAIPDLYADPVAALAELDDLVEGQKNSVMLRVLRAIAMAEAAKTRRDEFDLQKSMSEFEWANVLITKNRFLQTKYLQVITNMIQFLRSPYGESSELEIDAVALQHKAEQLVQSLEAVAESEAYSRVARATYFATIDDLERYQQVVDVATPGLTAQRQVQAAALFADRSYDELEKLRELYQGPTTDVFVAFGKIERESSREDRRRIAQETFDSAFEAGGEENNQGGRVLLLEVFLLAGEIDDLKRNALRLMEESPVFEWYQYDRTLALYVDPSEERLREYVLEAEPFSEASSYANHVAGLFNLAWGRRSEALEHFNRATEQGKFDWWSHVWSQAFASRLSETGSTWPTWIDASKTE
ncbi:MAG: serine/threonine-protein kinase [Planctomycetota bacterium]